MVPEQTAKSATLTAQNIGGIDETSEYLVVALLSEDAATLSDGYERITGI